MNVYHRLAFLLCISRLTSVLALEWALKLDLLTLPQLVAFTEWLDLPEDSVEDFADVQHLVIALLLFGDVCDDV